MKTFYVGVKAIIQDERGVLLLLRSQKEGGHWDFPGGRLEQNETFEEALARELSEELPDSKLLSVGQLTGAMRLPQDIHNGIGLVLLQFKVTASLPPDIKLSDEHTDFKWVKSVQDIPTMDIRDNMRQILQECLTNP